jgi:hypothetical protein
MKTEPVQHLTQAELARRWRMSERTLEAWRPLNMGPPYLKIVGRVVYRLSDVESYEADNLFNSGSVRSASAVRHHTRP